MGRVLWEVDTVSLGESLLIDGVIFKYVNADNIKLIDNNELISKYIDYIIEHDCASIKDLQLLECDLFKQASSLLTETMKSVRWYKFDDLWSFLHTDIVFHSVMEELLLTSFYRDESLFSEQEKIVPFTDPMLHYNKLLKCNLRSKILPSNSEAHIIAYSHNILWEAYNK